MRKASQILFLVGAILAVIGVFFSILMGVLFLVAPEAEFIQEVIDRIVEEAHVSEKAAEELVKIISATSGIALFIEAALCGVGAFFGFKAVKEGKANTTLCVLNIVFGALSSIYVLIVGAIFGLIANNQEEKQQKNEIEQQ